MEIEQRSVCVIVLLIAAERYSVNVLNCGFPRGNVSLKGFQSAANFLVNRECNDVRTKYMHISWNKSTNKTKFVSRGSCFKTCCYCNSS